MAINGQRYFSTGNKKQSSIRKIRKKAKTTVMDETMIHRGVQEVRVREDWVTPFWNPKPTKTKHIHNPTWHLLYWSLSLYSGCMYVAFLHLDSSWTLLGLWLFGLGLYDTSVLSTTSVTYVKRSDHLFIENNFFRSRILFCFSTQWWRH